MLEALDDIGSTSALMFSFVFSASGRAENELAQTIESFLQYIYLQFEPCVSAPAATSRSRSSLADALKSTKQGLLRSRVRPKTFSSTRMRCGRESESILRDQSHLFFGVAIWVVQGALELGLKL
jgi:hypothetical protein